MPGRPPPPSSSAKLTSALPNPHHAPSRHPFLLCASATPQIESTQCLGDLILLLCQADFAGAARTAPALGATAQRCIGFSGPAAVICSDGRRIPVGGPEPELMANANASALLPPSVLLQELRNGTLNMTGLNQTALGVVGAGGIAPQGAAATPPVPGALTGGL